MSRASVILKRTFRLLKFLLVCVVISICIFMIWRVSSTGTPKEIKHLTPNEKLNEAYEAKGEELYIFDQNYDKLTRDEKAYGYFAVPDAVFIPEANQAQIVFRYNNSTITSLASDYSLQSIPNREQNLFDVSLVFYIDLTPDNPDDNYEKGTDTVKEIRCLPSYEQSEKTTLYNFYRYVFDFENAEETIELSELLDDGSLIAIHAQVYYNEDLNYDQNPYGALCIYDYRKENRQIELTSKDKKALEGQ